MFRNPPDSEERPTEAVGEEKSANPLMRSGRENQRKREGRGKIKYEIENESKTETHLLVTSNK